MRKRGWLAEAFVSAVCLSTTAVVAEPPPVQLTVQANRPVAPPTQIGIFFEDVNFAGDGGLYPELVKNRSFEFPQPLMGWREIALVGARGRIEVHSEESITPLNPHYARLTVTKAGEGYGISNEGFRGMGVKKGEHYEFSIHARAVGSPAPSLRVEVMDQDGFKIGGAEFSGFGGMWQKYSHTIKATKTDGHAYLNLILQGEGAVELDLASLYPKTTWKNRPNGLRTDLVQLLADLKPAFMRFPGGCIVEGHTLPLRYQWKTTVGEVSQRRLLINRWNDEFKHRPAPDYYQSFGLGFYEYFQLCEDIGAKPLPILNCGMACQFNSKELAPLDQLEPYIQDALDLIEFANGPVTSTWGRYRASLGHPAPFQLSLLGVGNEQWGPQYFERYERFARVLKEKHPDIQLISSSGPSPDGKDFDYAWGRLRELKADLVDEHYYQAPSWFLSNTHRYDGYDRRGPKVFAGEYAAQSVKTVSPENRNSWECALAEAAFMTGLERNSDVVTMASYAPLFAHADGWQWTPNLIWFDSLKAYGTPNYYVQQLFSVHRGTAVVAATLGGDTAGMYASASLAYGTGELIVKAVNSTSQRRPLEITAEGVRILKAKDQAIVLASGFLKTENSLDAPRNLAPETREWPVQGPKASYLLEPYSLTVLRIRTGK